MAISSVCEAKKLIQHLAKTPYIDRRPVSLPGHDLRCKRSILKVEALSDLLLRFFEAESEVKSAYLERADSLQLISFA
jgi:CII-binding regulator of phage lambda lysogenization HflD